MGLFSDMEILVQVQWSLNEPMQCRKNIHLWFAHAGHKFIYDSPVQEINSSIIRPCRNALIITCMYSLVSFQMRTLCVDFRTTRMITEVNSSFFQIRMISSVVLNWFDDKFTAICRDGRWRFLMFKAFPFPSRDGTGCCSGSSLLSNRVMWGWGMSQMLLSRRVWTSRDDVATTTASTFLLLLKIEKIRNSSLRIFYCDCTFMVACWGIETGIWIDVTLHWLSTVTQSCWTEKKTRLKILPVLTREHYTSLLHWV
jgi:hypothetical protein